MITWFKKPIAFEIDCFQGRSRSTIENIRSYLKENKIKHKFKWAHEKKRDTIVDIQTFKNILACMKLFDHECRYKRIMTGGMMSYALGEHFLQMELHSMSKTTHNGEFLKLYVYNDSDAVTLKLMFTEWIYKI